MSSSDSDSDSSQDSSPVVKRNAPPLVKRGKASDKKGSNKSEKSGLQDVILVGIEGRSGRREMMKRDKQYKCIVFEQIVPLVPNFLATVSDLVKNPEKFDKFIKQISRAYGSARSNDANGFKTKMPSYICPPKANRAEYLIPEVSNKTEWGWNNTVTVHFLCPMQLIDKFNKDPETFREKVQSGRRVIKASDYPMFLYNTDKYKPGDIYSGLFQGPLLVKYYRHVFTGPTSSTKETSSGGKVARGIMHKLKAPMPRTIAYVAIMLRWALSSLPGFQNNDKGFNLVEFYHNILTTFNEPVNFEDEYNVDQSTAEWIASTLRWWKAKVPGLQKGCIDMECEGEDEGGSEDSDEGESDLAKLKAIRNCKPGGADNSAIDPTLLRPSMSLSPRSLPGSNVSESTTAVSQVDSASLAQAQAPLPQCRPGTVPPPGPAAVPRVAPGTVPPPGPTAVPRVAPGTVPPPGPAAVTQVPVAGQAPTSQVTVTVTTPSTVAQLSPPAVAPPSSASATSKTAPHAPSPPTTSANKRQSEDDPTSEAAESDLTPVTSPSPKRSKRSKRLEEKAEQEPKSKPTKSKPAKEPKASVKKSSRKKY